MCVCVCVCVCVWRGGQGGRAVRAISQVGCGTVKACYKIELYALEVLLNVNAVF